MSTAQRERLREALEALPERGAHRQYGKLVSLDEVLAALAHDRPSGSGLRERMEAVPVHEFADDGGNFDAEGYRDALILAMDRTTFSADSGKARRQAKEAVDAALAHDRPSGSGLRALVVEFFAAKDAQSAAIKDYLPTHDSPGQSGEEDAVIAANDRYTAAETALLAALSGSSDPEADEDIRADIRQAAMGGPDFTPMEWPAKPETPAFGACTCGSAWAGESHRPGCPASFPPPKTKSGDWVGSDGVVYHDDYPA
jgi:hypothetical protein